MRRSRAGKPRQEEDGTPIRVTDEHLAAALDQLLDIHNELTRVLLGGQAAQADAQRAGDGGAPRPLAVRA